MSLSFLINSLVFFFLTGLLCFSFRHKHLLLTLLSLEYIMLNIFCILVLQIFWAPSELFMTLVFLVFTVIEGGIGLSLLISVSRSHGSDQMKSFNLLW